LLGINYLTHLTQSVKQARSWSPEFIPCHDQGRNKFRTPTATATAMARNKFRTPTFLIRMSSSHKWANNTSSYHLISVWLRKVSYLREE